MDQQTLRDQFPFAVARVTRRWRKLLDERLKDEAKVRRAMDPKETLR